MKKMHPRKNKDCNVSSLICLILIVGTYDWHCKLPFSHQVHRGAGPIVNGDMLTTLFFLSFVECNDICISKSLGSDWLILIKITDLTTASTREHLSPIIYEHRPYACDFLHTVPYYQNPFCQPQRSALPKLSCFPVNRIVFTSTSFIMLEYALGLPSTP